MHGTSEAFKRVFDILASSLLLVVLSIPMTLIALATRLVLGSPRTGTCDRMVRDSRGSGECFGRGASMNFPSCSTCSEAI
jgi:hypothetical protein